MLADTQPSRRIEQFQPMKRLPPPKRKRLHVLRWLLLIGLLVYFLAPFRTNILLLGTDDSPQRGSLGRTDTIILTTILPTKPYIGMLSIPRDLWVTVPGVGEQRINTAFFYAEANKAGSGPRAALQTVALNFGLPVNYYAVLHMYGLVAAVDALGGVDVQINAGSGTYHLNGQEALAFVRERSTSDDFSRMRRTQILILAMGAKALQPASWSQIPRFLHAILQAVDTDIPIWQWPRLIFAILRVPFFGVDSRTISSDMVYPFVTAGGAQVLAPNWDVINPMLLEMFGR